jgi:hypothetical protein
MIGEANNYTKEEVQAYKLIVFQLIQTKTGKKLINVED